MRRLCLTLLFALPVLSLASADSRCVQNPKDPYDPGISALKGQFKGRCIDTTSVRPPVLLSENPSEIQIANFYLQGTYWIARIPKGVVRTVYFQIVPFASEVPFIKAAHTQFRFRLDKKIALSPQFPGEENSKPGLSDDIIVSSTYSAPVGETYSVLKSRGGSYGIVTRVMSSLDRAKEEILKDKSTVHQYELKLTEEQKNRLLVLVIQRAAKAGYTETYGLLKNNCTTLAFDSLDLLRAPPEGVPPMRGNLWNIRDEFIQPSLDALVARGWIDRPPKEAQSMNSEMVCHESTGTCGYLVK